MIRFCDWTFETKVTIVCDSFFGKPVSTLFFISIINRSPRLLVLAYYIKFTNAVKSKICIDMLDLALKNA